MNLRIVGRPGGDPRVVDLDGPEPMHPDDRVLGSDGEPLGKNDATPTDSDRLTDHEA
jgi:hypothetical protein